MIGGLAGKCVDVSAWGTTNGTKIQLWECLDGTNQQWRLNTNGTIEMVGMGAINKCLTLTDPTGPQGTTTILGDCTGAAGQLWTVQADGSLKHQASGRCLDVTGINSANGTQLQVWECLAGVAQQRWYSADLDTAGTQGVLYQSEQWDAAGQVSFTRHRQTVTTTATRPATSGAAVNAGQTLTARMVRETDTRTRTWVAATNTWRRTQTRTSYDSYGLVVDETDDGDLAVSRDETCTHTDYARDTGTKYLINYPSQVITTDCTVNPGEINTLQGSQTLYDDTTTVGAAPTKGLATKSLDLASYSGGTRVFKQSSRTAYDSYGRTTSNWDALDYKSTTTYTPATGASPTTITVTNPAGHTTTSTIEPVRGVTTKIVDANNKAVTTIYDPLGRLVKVWKANRPTSTTPDLEYGYTLQTGAPNVVTIKTLNPTGSQVTSYQLYDGRLRLRQSQVPGSEANGGRIITDSAFNDRGEVAKTSTFWNNSAPATTLASFADAGVQNQHRYTYDLLGRKIVDALWSANALKWQTSTTYDGDRTTVTPPSGGTAATTLVDVAGNTTELRQYLGGSPTGTYLTTKYEYDRLDRLTKLTDPAGNEWASTYDLRGRLVTSSDPDKGAATMTYDDAGRVLTSKDSREITLAYGYDNLGRKTGLFDGSTSGTKRAEWVYDTLAKGQLTRSVRYVVSGSTTSAYTVAVTGYDDAYRPTGTEIRLPAVEGTLAGTYETTATFHENGSQATTSYPQSGGLAAETVTVGYDSVGNPLTLIGADTYIAGTTYYQWGPVYQQVLGAGGKRVRMTTALDEATGRLTTASTDTESPTAPGSWTNQLTEVYTHDPAGSVRSIREASGTTTVSNQCFSYDGLGQLAEAWTTTAAVCQSVPTQASVGGPEPYWSSYTYTSLGLRQTETKHVVTGDNTRSYVYPTGTNVSRPHALTKVTMAGANTGEDSFGYDAAGNTTSRALAGKPGQTLTWDAEGHLASISDSSGTSSYIYDADGNRLIGREPGGTTAYLGAHELKLSGSGALTCTRFYGTVAVRTTGGGLSWQIADHHSTADLSIAATDLSTTRRRFDPFGNARSTLPAWPTTRGFINGTADPSGLTHLGAREYDPTTGRFVSVDPIMELGDPQQFNGYTYSGNDPVSTSDPDGLKACADDSCSPGMDWVDIGGNYHEAEKRVVTPETPKGDARVRKSPTTKTNSPYKRRSVVEQALDFEEDVILFLELEATVTFLCGILDSIACSLWMHYSAGTGDDYEINPIDILRDEFAAGVASTGNELAENAAALCDGPVGTTCTVDVNSMWREVNFQDDLSLKLGIGHMRYRMWGTVTVTVGEHEKTVSGTYTLDVYKNWNFDKDKADIGGFMTLDDYALMQERGIGTEFVMKGSAADRTLNVTVPR